MLSAFPIQLIIVEVVVTTSEADVIDKFKDIIFKESSITVTVRSPRGSDIGAACGQLKSEFDDKAVLQLK